MASKKEQVIGGTLSIEPFLLSIALALTAASVISFCIARRFSGVVALRALPVARARTFDKSKPRCNGITDTGLCDSYFDRLLGLLAFRVFEHRPAIQLWTQQLA